MSQFSDALTVAERDAAAQRLLTEFAGLFDTNAATARMLARLFAPRTCGTCRFDTMAPACGAGWHRPSLHPEFLARQGCSCWAVKDTPHA